MTRSRARKEAASSHSSNHHTLQPCHRHSTRDDPYPGSTQVGIKPRNYMRLEEHDGRVRTSQSGHRLAKGSKVILCVHGQPLLNLTGLIRISAGSMSDCSCGARRTLALSVEGSFPDSRFSSFRVVNRLRTKLYRRRPKRKTLGRKNPRRGGY
jgi:antitoxin (DNA-binding transcriptional repressor) of toxin-antitoxin stability system